VRHFSALVLLLALLPALARADARSDAQQALTLHQHAANTARLRARADAAQAALLAEQQVEAAAALRRLEDETSADAQHLSDLQTSQASASAQLQGAEAGLEKLLPVMQRLSAQPEATLLAAPQSPQDAVRGIAIMQGIATAIAAQATQVKTLSAQLAANLAAARTAQAQLATAVTAQQSAEDALSTQIDAAKTAEMADADTAAREAQASLAAQHKLDSIAAAIARLVPAAPEMANLPVGTGGAPVAGHIVQAFGAATLAGPATGVSYSAAPGARVVTPCAGGVMFAGAFPAYGLMVIADCGGGASVVLAGMNHLDVATGERLARGQPVGTMLGYDPTNPTRQPVLYVELRKNGAPVDPTSWLAANRSG
jgi:septal ring factor EnvC (AmiA/AmiB activator)